MPASGSFIHRYISDSYEFLTQEDKDLLSEFWSALIQVAGSVEQRVLETTVSSSVDHAPDLLTDRWSRYEFTSSTASLGVSSGATSTIDGVLVTGEPLSFGSSGATEALLNSAVTQHGLLVGHRFTGQRYVLGQDFSVNMPSGSITHIPDGAIPVGQDLVIRYSYMSPVGPVPGFPYAIEIPEKVKSIPKLQDAIVSPTYRLYENVDYKAAGGLLSFKSPPGANLWAEITLIDEQTAYRNFGHWIEFFLESSPQYVRALQALYYAYFTGSQEQTIEQAVASLLGLPIARESGVVVSAVSASSVEVPISEVVRPYKVVTDGSENLTTYLSSDEDNGEGSLVYVTGVGDYVDALDVRLVAENALLLEFDALPDYTAASGGISSIDAPDSRIIMDDPSTDVESLFPSSHTCRISGSAFAANNQAYVVAEAFNQGNAGNPLPGNALLVLETPAVPITSEPFSGATLTNTNAKIIIPRQIRVREVDESGAAVGDHFSQIIHHGLTETVAVGDSVDRFQMMTDGVEIIDKTIDADFVINEVGRAGIQRFLTGLATTGVGSTDETLALSLLKSHLWVARIHGSVFNYLITFGDIHTFLERIKPAYTEYILQILESFDEGVELSDIELPLELVLDLTETINFNYPNHLEFGVNMPIASFTQAPPRITTSAPHDTSVFANVGEDVQVDGLPSDNGIYLITGVDPGGTWIDVDPAPGAVYSPAPATADVFIHGTDAEYSAAGGYPYLDISAGHVHANDEAEIDIAATNWPIYSFVSPFSNVNSIQFVASGLDFVFVPHHASIDFDLTDKFSVSLWMKRTTIAADSYMISKTTASITSTGWSFGWNASDRLVVEFRDNAASASLMFESTIGYTSTAWRHVAFSYDGGSIALAWVDGIEAPMTLTATGTMATISHPDQMVIGNAPTSLAPIFFDGFIDEVSIWNDDLSGPEIEEIFNGGTVNHLAFHSKLANLVSWWRMGDGADAIDGTGAPSLTNIVNDVAEVYTVSTHANTGTPTGSTWTQGIKADVPPSAATSSTIVVNGSLGGPPYPYSGGGMLDLVIEPADEIVVSGASEAANNTTFTVASVSGSNTVEVVGAVVDEPPDSSAVYSLTKDFTI